MFLWYLDVLSHRSLRIRLVGGSILLLALLLAGPLSEASASCGDYVRIAGPEGSVSTEGHPPITPQVGAVGAPSNKPGRPCDGPGCHRKGPDRAPLPAPSPPSQPHDAALEALQFDSPRSSTKSLLPCAFLPVPGLPTSIFHPPRA